MGEFYCIRAHSNYFRQILKLAAQDFAFCWKVPYYWKELLLMSASLPLGKIWQLNTYKWSKYLCRTPTVWFYGDFCVLFAECSLLSLKGSLHADASSILCFTWSKKTQAIVFLLIKISNISITWDQAFFFCFFVSLARERKKITPDTFI